jgi:hypothetical protein
MRNETNSQTPFKTCPTCDHVWQNREDFLSDEEIQVVGYQVHFEDLKLGLFLFNHRECGSCIALEAGGFRDLYDGEIFSERLTGGPNCPGHCLHEEMLGPCPAACECAYVREILDIIVRIKKPS